MARISVLRMECLGVSWDDAGRRVERVGTLEGVGFVLASWVRFREEMFQVVGQGVSLGDAHQRPEQWGWHTIKPKAAKVL